MTVWGFGRLRPVPHKMKPQTWSSVILGVCYFTAALGLARPQERPPLSLASTLDECSQGHLPGGLGGVRARKRGALLLPLAGRRLRVAWRADGATERPLLPTQLPPGQTSPSGRAPRCSPQPRASLAQPCRRDLSAPTQPDSCHLLCLVTQPPPRLLSGSVSREVVF